MGANIGDTDCKVCDGEVRLEEPPRPVSRSDMGPNDFAEYDRIGLVVARARCARCGARYLAWVDVTSFLGCHLSNADRSRKFVDLSFRGSFREEPATEDLPPVEMLREVEDERRRQRIAAIDGQIADLERKISKARRSQDDIAASIGGPSPWESYLDLARKEDPR